MISSIGPDTRPLSSQPAKLRSPIARERFNLCSLSFTQSQRRRCHPAAPPSSCSLFLVLASSTSHLALAYRLTHSPRSMLKNHCCTLFSGQLALNQQYQDRKAKHHDVQSTVTFLIHITIHDLQHLSGQHQHHCSPLGGHLPSGSEDPMMQLQQPLRLEVPLQPFFKIPPPSHGEGIAKLSEAEISAF